MHGINEVAKVTAKAIELPDDQGIACAQRLEAGDKTKPVIAAAGSEVIIDVLGLDASGKKCIHLQVRI